MWNLSAGAKMKLSRLLSKIFALAGTGRK